MLVPPGELAPPPGGNPGSAKEKYLKFSHLVLVLILMFYYLHLSFRVSALLVHVLSTGWHVRDMLEIYLCSFPVIHKVGNVGIFV